MRAAACSTASGHDRRVGAVGLYIARLARFAQVLRLRVYQCMEVLHTWGPDIFHLSEVANGNPLTPVAYTILKVNDRTSQSLETVRIAARLSLKP